MEKTSKAHNTQPNNGMWRWKEASHLTLGGNRVGPEPHTWVHNIFPRRSSQYFHFLAWSGLNQSLGTGMVQQKVLAPMKLPLSFTSPFFTAFFFFVLACFINFEYLSTKYHLGSTQIHKRRFYSSEKATNIFVSFFLE